MTEQQQQLHRLTLVSNDEEPVEEWRCPICGRWLLVRFDPFSRIILNEGDPEATHWAGKGGVKLTLLFDEQQGQEGQ